MATLKHINSKNADYGAAEQYLLFEHDEFTMKPVLDETGRLISREDYRLSTLNCGGEDFAVACMRANLRYEKNQRREDVKSHYYIISFDPRDGPDNGLTVDRAQELGEKFCAEHFPGHQALVCTHPDGHNHSGNIHVHIVINSLRIEEVPFLPYMDRPADTKAGCKHRCTDAALRYSKSEVMEMCHREGLYQIDLLNGSKNRVTDREYWAQKKGQAALDSDDEALNAAIAAAQSLLNDPDNASVTAVVSALLDLSEAMQVLNTDESTDALRADVQATINFINENILNDVEGLRPGKVEALKDAVAAAEELLASEDATADELKAANKAMTKAAQELWEIVSKAELNALIEAANGYLDGSYTTESLEALQAAIDAAQAVAINDDATTAEVTDAITNLSSAIAGLESITLDTSALEHEIELVSEMIANIDNYVPSSVEGLQEKLDAAKAVLNNATSQAAIDEATKSLREARLNARTKADTSALEEIIAYANSLDLAGYAAESRNMLDRTIVAVKRVLADPEATQEEVEQAVQTMQTAIDSLQLVENSTGSTTADTTNTAAAAQTAAFACMLAVSAAGIFLFRRKRQMK